MRFLLPRRAGEKVTFTPFLRQPASNSDDGTYFIPLFRCLDFAWWIAVTIGLLLIAPVTFGAELLVRQGDNAQTGANTNELSLTPANVNSNSFGIIAVRAIDGKPFAQPIVVAGANIPGSGLHNLLVVATEHDSVYAFDADDTTPGSQPLWLTSFINPQVGITPVLPADIGAANISPEIGISGTPVIDAQTGTIYVVAKTKETGPSGTVFANRLHALDLATGKERPGSPVLLTAMLPGTGYGGDGRGNIVFNQLLQMNRPGLALVKNATHSNGLVYITMGSHNDNGGYHGWIFGVDASNLTMAHAFNVTPNGGYGAIWMSGGAPAVDGAGNLYVSTANGSFDASLQNFGDTVLKLDTSGTNLVVADYFTPYDQAAMSLYDMDLGSGGVVLLPDSVGSDTHRHLAIFAGNRFPWELR